MNIRISFITVSSLLLSFIAVAQTPSPSTVEQIKQGIEQRQQLSDDSGYKNLSWENIGPTVMSGRVVDLAVNPVDPTEFFVAYASGGLWHTTTNGTSFTPLLDHTQTQNIGDIAVDWNTGTVWVGTGENNSSRSSYAGIGLLKSVDKGKTWSEPMLINTQHIGRILIDPQDTNHVIVAAMGALYSDSSDRGIFITRDGGKSFTKTLFVNEQTGIIDLVAVPGDFNTLYASSWQRDRKAWHFEGSGSGSAIYKSTNAGASWVKISTEGSGFPTGGGVGRIGLDVFDGNTMYALHDSQFRKEKTTDKKSGSDSSKLTKEDFKNMSKEEFLQLDNERLDAFLKTNGFQEKYKAVNVKNNIAAERYQPQDLAAYLEDANSLLFDTPIKGAELYRSDDGGKNWFKTHEEQIEDLYYSYGYYFGEVRIDPLDKDHVYVLGVPLLKSLDGGKTFESIWKENVHADHHALWVNPYKRGHLINGNDGGVNISYDDGDTWIKNNTPAVGQFYAINVDDDTPYNVYGGLQDNGTWTGAHNATQDRAWEQKGHYPWKSIMGGDGMHIQIDKRNSSIVYAGYQFGNYFRINKKTEETTYIQPKHELGERPYRFNWQTPILLSPHQQDILYLGGNKLMRSMNQGEDWTAISNDLTKGGKKGNVAYGTLTSISESSFQFGLLYAGSDDGLVHVTHDSGATWKLISSSFPKDLWVSRVVASAHKKSRVYVTLNAYRWDDFTPYVYKSEDYGMSWERIDKGLPLGAVNVIVESPDRENTLIIGTDNAAYVSKNAGVSWELVNPSLPAVAVHDIKIQCKAGDVLLGTHGRSIYLASLDEVELAGSDLALAKVDSLRFQSRWGTKSRSYSEINEPKITVVYNLPAAGKVVLKVKNEKKQNAIYRGISWDKRPEQLYV